MHELIAFLFGATLILAGFYVWWTRRRFHALKTAFTEVIARAERLDTAYDRLDARFDRHIIIVDRHTREIAFLLDDRVVPPADEPNQPVREAKADQQQTVWDRLKANVEEL